MRVYASGRSTSRVPTAPGAFLLLRAASGTLWKATQASADEGGVAWGEIVSQMREAVSTEFD